MGRDGRPCPATVRGIYRFHTIDRAVGDIGYQLLIDEAGSIYGGRYSGGDLPGHRVVQSPAGGVVFEGVQGAHVGGSNSGNFGVSLLGNLVDRPPTGAALRSLIGVLAILARIHHLDPFGDAAFVNPVSGATVEIPNISGHSQWSATECPGSLLDLLPPIRASVDRALGRGPGAGADPVIVSTP